MIKDFTVCFSCGQVLTLPIWYSEEYKRAIRSMNDIRTKLGTLLKTSQEIGAFWTKHTEEVGTGTKHQYEQLQHALGEAIKISNYPTYNYQPYMGTAEKPVILDPELATAGHRLSPQVEKKLAKKKSRAALSRKEVR